ncbi:hypothetical protein [Gluconobacter cerinus]|nr:hypothetical protein [Gluconobacter cerinus]
MTDKQTTSSMSETKLPVSQPVRKAYGFMDSRFTAARVLLDSHAG